jgi:pimeloyl-ACP methyl ester carboxylesterase
MVWRVADDVVLVHGAWHGSWCWDRVVPALAQPALRVTALDLPGHGAEGGAMADLHGDAAAVADVLDRLETPAVLVGHSYGGAVISEAGDHPMVERLVFIAALVLDAGESCMEAAVAESEAAGIEWEGRPNLADGFVVAEDGMVTLDPDVARACLYNDCDDDWAAWALARIGPHPIGNLQQAARGGAWRAKPSTYVVCAQDVAVHPDLQRVLARRCSSTVEWPTGHSPFLSRPELVTGLLAAQAAGGGLP